MQWIDPRLDQAAQRCGARSHSRLLVDAGSYWRTARPAPRSAPRPLDRRSRLPIDRAQPPPPAGWHRRVPAPAGRSGPRRHPLIATGHWRQSALVTRATTARPTSVAGHSGCSQEFPPYVSKLLQSCVWTPGIARWVQYSVSGPRAAAHGNDFRRRRFHVPPPRRGCVGHVRTRPAVHGVVGAAAAPSVVDRAGHASGGPGHRRRPRQRAGAADLGRAHPERGRGEPDDGAQRRVPDGVASRVDRFRARGRHVGCDPLTWRRCRAVATALLVATFARPAIEFIVKGLVGRDRPDFDRLVAGTDTRSPVATSWRPSPSGACCPWWWRSTRRRAIWWWRWRYRRPDRRDRRQPCTSASTGSPT